MRVSRYEENRLTLLEAIESAARRHGRPPTVRMLADQAEVGVATLHSYLNKLAEEGLVEWQAKSHRSLHVTPAAIQLLSSSAEQLA